MTREQLVEVMAREMQRGVCKHCRQPCIGQIPGITGCDCARPEWDRATLAEQSLTALTAIETAGMVVVPVEPDERMKQVARTYFGQNPTSKDGGPLDHLWLSAWSAMIQAGRVT